MVSSAVETSVSRSASPTIYRASMASLRYERNLRAISHKKWQLSLDHLIASMPEAASSTGYGQLHIPNYHLLLIANRAPSSMATWSPQQHVRSLLCPASSIQANTISFQCSSKAQRMKSPTCMASDFSLVLYWRRCHENRHPLRPVVMLSEYNHQLLRQGSRTWTVALQNAGRIQISPEKTQHPKPDIFTYKREFHQRLCNWLGQWKHIMWFVAGNLLLLPTHSRCEKPAGSGRSISGFQRCYPMPVAAESMHYFARARMPTETHMQPKHL